jgi:hypothetical protein
MLTPQWLRLSWENYVQWEILLILSIHLLFNNFNSGSSFHFAANFDSGRNSTAKMRELGTELE